MKNMLIGLTLILFDFSLTFGGHSFELLPDFIGYWLLAQNMLLLKGQSTFFAKYEPAAKGATAFAALVYLLDVIGLNISWLNFLLGLLCALLQLAAAWICLQGIRELEALHKQDLLSAALEHDWKTMSLCVLISYLLSHIMIIGVLGWLVALIFILGFMVDFKQAVLRFEHPQETPQLSAYTEE